MNAKTQIGHWADSSRLHSDAQLGPNTRFLELEEAADLDHAKASLPMAVVCLVVVLFPFLLIGVGSLVIHVLR